MTIFLIDQKGTKHETLDKQISLFDHFSCINTGLVTFDSLPSRDEQTHLIIVKLKIQIIIFEEANDKPRQYSTD